MMLGLLEEITIGDAFNCRIELAHPDPSCQEEEKKPLGLLKFDLFFSLSYVTLEILRLMLLYFS